MEELKIVWVENEKVYMPLRWPNTIKGDKLEYFIMGQGYKKTKKFKIEDVVLPCPWSLKSWLEVARIGSKWGLHVANAYAEKMTAGIVSMQSARDSIRKYETLLPILGEEINETFIGRRNKRDVL